MRGKTAGMERLPFGIDRLDALIGGGAPSGSTVLLSGEPGAGAREFLHTAALMHGLAQEESDQLRVYYGDMHPDVELPEEVHYVSLTDGPEHLGSEMRVAMDPDLVDEAMPGMHVADLSTTYFHLSPVPRSWYRSDVADIASLSNRGDRRGIFEELGGYLTDHAPGSVVCIDSITDLVCGIEGEFQVEDVALVLKGLRRVSSEWGGLVLLLLDRTTLSERAHGMLRDSVDGTFEFEWERGGNDLNRTMRVTKFQGVLPRLEADDIVKFETEITEGGFDISDVRKLR